jgi:hypothetical protein
MKFHEITTSEFSDPDFKPSISPASVDLSSRSRASGCHKGREATTRARTALISLLKGDR